MSFVEMLFSLLAAGFTFFGLFSLGNILASTTGLRSINGHGKIALGVGLFSFSFFLFSLFIPPAFVWYAWIFLFALAILTQRNFIVKSLGLIQWSDPFVWVLFVLFLPYIFRLVGLPLSDDGLSFYLPNVAWIFAKGIEFNPYLTNYTLMPLGMEYVFTIPFGFTGIPGVLVFDALGSIALLHLIYTVGKKLFSIRMAQVLVLTALLIKGTLFYLFGTGKIDTWNTYVIVSGIFLFIQNCRKREFTGVFLIFSIALGIKFTNWLLLILPLCYLFYELFRREKFRKVALLAMVPLFFAGSVMIRNQLEVNNPLAPIFLTGNESRFVETHGKMPDEQILVELVNDGNENLSFMSGLLNDFIFPLGVILVALIWVVWFRKVKISIELAQSLILIILMFLPWFIVLGNSNQPLRFIWTPLILGIVILLKAIDELLQSKPKLLENFKNIALGVLTLVAFTVVFSKHSFHMVNFFKFSNHSLSEWYSLAGKNHYAISYRFKEMGLHHADVHYKVPVALGAFDVDDYGNIPEQDELSRMSTSTILSADFVIDIGMDKLDTLPQEDIVMQYGDYFVYKLRK
tara:strand:+ start:4695 stop:6413 length:1719 start_codon:yes stop_codon:yes gene_type:complete